MKFSSTFSGLINKTIHYNLFNSPGPISVYSGVQPSADALESSWSSYNATNSNFLAHFPAPGWTSNATSINNTGATCLYVTYSATGNVTPIHSGTATWAIIWDSSVVSAPSASTIPTTTYLIVDVGSMVGNAATCVRMANTTLSTTTVTRIEDVGFTLTQP